MSINTERKALEIQRNNGVINDRQYRLSLIRLADRYQESELIDAKIDNIDAALYGRDGIALEEVEPRRPHGCLRCRTTRSEILCLGCPNIGLRNVWKSLEESFMIAIVAGSLSSVVAICIYWGARG